MIRWCPANMRGGREHRELGRRETTHVAVRPAAAEQTKELHRVRDAHAVCIPDQDQGGCFERRHALCPIVVLAHQMSRLGNEGRPGFGPGRGLEIGFVYRGSGKYFDAYRGHSCEDLGIPPITLEGGRGECQLAHHLWMPDGGL